MVDSTEQQVSEHKNEQSTLSSPPVAHLDDKMSSHSDHDSMSDNEAKAPKDGAALRAVDSNAEPDYPPMRKVAVIMAALYMSFFLVALVRTRFLAQDLTRRMLR